MSDAAGERERAGEGHRLAVLDKVLVVAHAIGERHRHRHTGGNARVSAHTEQVIRRAQVDGPRGEDAAGRPCGAAARAAGRLPEAHRVERGAGSIGAVDDVEPAVGAGDHGMGEAGHIQGGGLIPAGGREIGRAVEECRRDVIGQVGRRVVGGAAADEQVAAAGTAVSHPGRRGERALVAGVGDPGAQVARAVHLSAVDIGDAAAAGVGLPGRHEEARDAVLRVAHHDMVVHAPGVNARQGRGFGPGTQAAPTAGGAEINLVIIDAVIAGTAHDINAPVQPGGTEVAQPER